MGLKKRFSLPFKALALTLASTMFWLDVVWALDPRQKLLDDAREFLELQAGAPTGSSSAPLETSFSAQNAAAVDSQNTLQALADQNAAAQDASTPEGNLTLKTSAGDLLQMADGTVTQITRADGTILAGLKFDTDGRITDANLRLNDGTIQVVQGGRQIAANLPDGTALFYNAAGRLEKAVLPDAKEILYTYTLDAQGAALSVTADSPDTTSVYDKDGVLQQTLFKATGRRIVYAAGVLDRVEEGGWIYRYTPTVTGDTTRVALDSVTDAAGNVYTLDAQGVVSAIQRANGAKLEAIRWQAGAIQDARVTLATKDVWVYQNAKLIRAVDAADVETVFSYDADKTVATSLGSSTEYSLAGVPLKRTLADGTVLTYNSAGAYKGYASQSVSAQGIVTLFDYTTDAAGKITAVQKNPVTTLQQVTTFKSASAIAYTSNPTLTFSFGFGGSVDPARKVQVLANNSASLKVLLNLTAGANSTYQFGTAAPVKLNVALDPAKNYTGEMRWETAGIGIYIYEAGKVRPAAPQARITTRTWNPTFSLTSTDALVTAYKASAGGAVTKTVQVLDKTSAPLTGNSIHKTTFRFDTAAATNRVALTATQPAVGTTQNTYTFTWLSGRWTLVKSSRNTTTGAVTTTTTTFSQALAAAKDYIADIRIEGSKVSLYVYDALAAKPAAAVLSSATLTQTATVQETLINATVRAVDAAKNIVSVDPKTFAAPVPAGDAKAKAELTAPAPDPLKLNLQDIVSVDYRAGKMIRAAQKDGSVSTFENGLLSSVASQGSVTNFLFSESAYGNLAQVTLDSRGLKTSYDAQGRIRSIQTADQTVFYENQKVVRIEKADGTRIEDLAFAANGSDILEAVVRLADGAVRRYAAGQISEERRPDGTVVRFSAGKPVESVMADGRVYAYETAPAGTGAAGGYVMNLLKYRTAEGDTVELDAASGVPARITRNNGDVVTPAAWDAAGDLKDYTVSTRDASGARWTLTFTARTLVSAQSETGEKAFFENGRLARVAAADGSVKNLSYALDAQGRVLYTTVAEGLEQRTFDADSNLVRYEHNGLTAEYDAAGMKSIWAGDVTYLKPVFAADGSLVSGQIVTEDGAVHTLAGGKLTRTRRADGVEVSFDPSGSGLVTGILEGSTETQFAYARDAAGNIIDIQALGPGGTVRQSLTDFLAGRTNAGYLPVKGQGGWNQLTQFNTSGGIRFADKTGVSAYRDTRPAGDTESRVYIPSTAAATSTSDRTGIAFGFDNYHNLSIKQGGFIFVKLRIDNAPNLGQIRVRPAFGNFSTDLDDLARVVNVTSGAMTVLIPVTHATTTPVGNISIDFIPPQKAADTWAVSVQQTGYFELDTVQSQAHQQFLTIAAADAAHAAGQPSASKIPTSAAWSAKAFTFNRVTAAGQTDLRMTVNADGEALASTRADGATYAYAAGRSSQVTAPDGTVTDYVYDASGQVSQIATQPKNGAKTITQYSYGKIRSITNAAGTLLYRYTYEFAGDREFTLIEDAQTGEVKRYSGAKLLSSRDAQDITTTYAYAADNPDRITSSAATWKGRELHRFTYTYEGAETRITDETGLTKIYDPSGSLTFLQTADGLRYKKTDLTDAQGAKVEEHALYSAKTQDGMTLFYKNDTVEKILMKDGSVINVADSADGASNVIFKEGLVDEVTHVDGSVAKYLRDEIGRLEHVDVTRGPKVFRYNPDGELLRVTDPAAGETTDYGCRKDTQGRVTATRVVTQTRRKIGALDLPVPLRAASYGMMDGWNSSITVDDRDYSEFNLETPAPDGSLRTRGWSVAHVDGTGKVVAKGYFDIYLKGTEESERMAAFLEAIPQGDAVIMAVADEGSKNLTERAVKAIESFGSSKVLGLGYRDSFALIGQKGAPAGSAIEDLKKLGEGAAIVSNAKDSIVYYDAVGKPLSYNEYASSPDLTYNSSHAFEAESNLEVFASNASGAAGWRKNFDPSHPDSGFIYLWGGPNNAQYTSNPENLSDYLALTSQAAPSEKYVYYDPAYFTNYTGIFAVTMMTHLTAHGFKVVTADTLKDFFATKGAGSALVMLQSVLPETVYDPLSPYSVSQRNIPREYMEKGGTIVWTHDLPFYYVARKGGTYSKIGEAGVRQMLGVIPSQRTGMPSLTRFNQTFDQNTDGYRLVGTGASFDVASGSIKFQSSIASPSQKLEALTVENNDELTNFDNLLRSVDVRVEKDSNLTVGFEGTQLNGSSASISVAFEADGKVRAYTSAGGLVWNGIAYQPGADYTVDLYEKGDWTELYIYPRGSARPIQMTAKILYPKWTKGTFVAKSDKGSSEILATRGYFARIVPNASAATQAAVSTVPASQKPLDASILTYETNVNFRQVSWQAVKSQIGNILKTDTPIVSTYDANGDLASLARADKTVLSYIPGSDKLDAVYDLKGYSLTDYTYDASGKLMEIRNEGQRRALEEALFDAKVMTSRRKFETLTEEALQKNYIEQTFIDKVDVQRQGIISQRNHYQNLLNELEPQKMRSSSAKKEKSQKMDAYREAIRTANEGLARIDEIQSEELVKIATMMDDRKIQIEDDYARAFTQLELEFDKTLTTIVLEEQKALTLHIYREVLSRDATASELLLVQTQAPTPQALRTSLEQSQEKLIRQTRKNEINQKIFSELDRSLAASDRASLLASLGLSESEVITFSASEIAKIKGYLTSQSLHFAESAIDPLMELLKSKGQVFTESDRTLLAARLILIDILTGQITPFLKEGEEMLVSLYAMQKATALYNTQSQGYTLTYDELVAFSAANPQDHPVLHVDGKHYVNLIQATATEITFLDGGETKKLPKEEFQKIWQGTILLPESHAPPVAVEKKITAAQAREIKGAFFWFIPMIFSAIASIAAAVASIIAAIAGIITSIITTIGTILSSLGQILTGIVQGIGSLTKAVFTGLKFAGTHLFGGGLSGLFAPATQGGFFGLSLNSLTATSLFKSAISVGLNYGLQRGLDALGVNPGISSVLTGFVTGGFLGGITPTGFNSSLFLDAAIKGAVQAGSKTLISASGISPIISNLLSITSGPLINGIWQGNLSGVLTTIRPLLTQSLASYGINKLGSSLGLDPRISGVLGIVGSSVIRGVSNGSSILSAINQGLVGGAVNMGMTFAMDKLKVPHTVRSLIADLLNRENPNNPGTTYGQTLIQGISNGISRFAQGIFKVASNTLSFAAQMAGKTTEAAFSIFRGAIKSVSSLFDQRTQESLLKEEGNRLAARFGRTGESFRYDNGQTVAEYDAANDTFNQYTANSSLSVQGLRVDSKGQIYYQTLTRHEVFEDGTVLEEVYESGALKKVAYYYQTAPIIRMDYSEGVTSAEGIFSSSGSIRFEAPVNVPITTGGQTKESTLPFTFDFSFSNGSITRSDVVVTKKTESDPKKDLYVLVNGVMNGKAKAEGAPDYLANLQGDMVLNSNGIVKHDDVILAGTYFTNGLLKLYETLSTAAELAATLVSGGTMSFVSAAIKELVLDLIPSGLKLGQDLFSLLAEASDPSKASWLVDDILAAAENYFESHTQADRLRNTIAMGYSGGFIPLTEALVRTPASQMESSYNVKTLVALGAATINIGQGIKDLLVKLAEAGDVIYHKKWTDLLTIQNVLNGLRMNLIELGMDVKDFVMDDVLGFLARGLNKEAYESYESKVSALTNLIDKTFQKPALDDLTSSKAKTVLNIWGSEDLLSKLKVNGTAIGGYRDNIAGFTQNDRNHTLINIEIMGATHNDYMYEDQDNPLAKLWTAFTDPKQMEWKKTVEDFVSRLMINGQNADSIQEFMSQQASLQLAYFDVSKNRWVVTLPGWSSR